jgi:hypothetical protein
MDLHHICIVLHDILLHWTTYACKTVSLSQTHAVLKDAEQAPLVPAARSGYQRSQRRRQFLALPRLRRAGLSPLIPAAGASSQCCRYSAPPPTLARQQPII